jgi:prophage antirepressor-like protein
MNNTPICPIYFENHEFGGHLYSIENFTNFKFGCIRTTILNGKPYFAAKDICIGLCLGTDNISRFVSEAVNDLGIYIYPLNQIKGVSMQELYYTINIEVTHPGNNGCQVKQMVQTLFVSESVLYMLMFRSRKREAIGFKAWLAVEILPNLRVLGRERAAAIIADETNAIRKAVTEISNKYDKLEHMAETTGLMFSSVMEVIDKERMDHSVEASIIDSKIKDLIIRVDSIGWNSNELINGQMDLTQKINGIASGLDMIFGGRRSA